MGKIKDPPRFSLDKPYDQWKTEIALWQLEQPADNTDTSKHAITIALAMPETGCNDVRARILASVKLFDIETPGDGACFFHAVIQQLSQQALYIKLPKVRII